MTGTLFLSRLVRPDVAKELTFTARIFDGREAAALGLATRLSDDPLGEALRPCRRDRRPQSRRPCAASKRAVQPPRQRRRRRAVRRRAHGDHRNRRARRRSAVTSPNVPVVARVAAGGDRIAVVDPGGTSTFSELDAAARSLADTLRDGRRDLADARVAVLAEAGHDFVVSCSGAGTPARSPCRCTRRTRCPSSTTSSATPKPVRS